ncbi:MAG: OmpH family outer membrane protein [Bacteroidales bacterium]|nr:OmpH family outer membrane protein [Candidatus Cryptobacteroides equifaecalis]
MKRINLILSAAAVVFALASCSNGATKTTETATGEGTAAAAAAGSYVYFNLDRVLQEYDMANDLRSVVETKVNSINQEVNRRGTALERDIKAFQDKINKGLITQSTAEVQSQKLQKQQNDFQQYAAQKQQEIAEEQAVMMNQLADAIKTFVDSYNAEKGYAMILANQGDILPSPVVAADSKLDITDDLLAGLNAAYVKEKGSKKE